MQIHLPDGRMVEATELEVADVSERWTTISMVNGDTIRIKYVVTQVFAIPGELDQQGHQVYSVNSFPVMVVRKEEPKATLS